MNHKMINLGCGPVFVNSNDWGNFDFMSYSPAVREANLLERIPIDSGSAELVYSSHFLEHIPRPSIVPFLSECLRILQPGGTLRLVLPDLEELARTYLALRDSQMHQKANFMVMGLIDQCVRKKSGGELGQLYNSLRSSEEKDYDLIDFIKSRTGETITEEIQLGQSDISGVKGRYSVIELIRKIHSKLMKIWIKLYLLGLPSAFREQNVRFTEVGECHQWLWDFYQLKQVLHSVGFVDVKRFSANSSSVADFPFYPLDIDYAGLPRKGLDSMYIEAKKPIDI
jgi:hypothetical protein